MRESMKTLVIQIVNYKTREYLIDCLDSVFSDLKESDLDYEINILDNDSGDDLSDLKSRYPERLSFYQNDKNVGFGAGHNLLAKRAESKYLLLLNPDIKLIEPGMIERLLERRHHFQAQILGPRLITAKGKTQWWDHGELTLLARIFETSGVSYWQERKKPVEAAWVSGAAFLVDRGLFDQLGGFDENFFLYREEEDLCLRAKKLGAKIIYDPTITILHYSQVVAKRSEYVLKSSDYFMKKHRKNLVARLLVKIVGWLKKSL